MGGGIRGRMGWGILRLREGVLCEGGGKGFELGMSYFTAGVFGEVLEGSRRRLLPQQLSSSFHLTSSFKSWLPFP
jgi:hypothetical protein